MRVTLHMCLLLTLAVSAWASDKDKEKDKPSSGALPEVFWPAPPATPRIAFVGEIWRRKPFSGPRQRNEDIRLNAPCGVAIDPFGRLYVTDKSTTALFRWDFAKNEFSMIGAESGQLHMPYGIAIDGEGSVYVTDMRLKKIVVFDKDGHYITSLNENNELEKPTGIAIDRERKRIIVSDMPRHMVYVMDLNGKILKAIGKKQKPGEHAGSKENGEFFWPGFVSVDSAGKFYVGDDMNYRVQVFSPQGRFLGAFGQNGDAPGDFHRLKGIAVDNQGDIWVVDAAFGNIQIFDQAYRLLTMLGQTGRDGPGNMQLPSGIVFDGKDRFYVADTLNARIQAFQLLSAEDGEKLKQQLIQAGKFNAPGARVINAEKK